MGKSIYTITILNFKKYNSSLKRGHKSTLISNNFCTDPELQTLPMTTRWLLLNLLLTCGDYCQDTIKLNAKQLQDMLECNRNIDRALDSLKQFQILTYEKNDLFINRIEKNIKEKNIKEFNDTSKKETLNYIEKEQNKKIWETYFNAYRLRYGIDAVRNAQINSQISNLRKKLGTDDACRVVTFYLSHNDSWYLKKTHEFGLCLKDAETLRTQMMRGKAITGTMVKTFEKSLQQKELNDQIETMWSEDVNK